MEDICRLCNKPLLAGQAIHGFRLVHWDCYEQHESPAAIDRDMNNQLAKLNEAIDKLDKLKRSL